MQSRKHDDKLSPAPVSEGSNEMKHTPERWNSRAESWSKLLKDDSSFKQSHEERVARACEFLRGHDLLRPEHNVIDLGCGPGRFVAEFARTAGHATGLDISDKMLANAEEYARRNGITNTSYITCDFKNADPEEEGWVGKFDLVFASITPAVGDAEGLKKAISMSRGWCFVSTFVHNEDTLRSRISTDVFETAPQMKPLNSGYWFHTLFNLLWLDGYYPETCYHMQDFDERVPLDDEIVSYYAGLFTKRGGDRTDAEHRVREYLSGLLDGDGLILNHIERRYGWVLWDVRLRGSTELRRGSADRVPPQTHSSGR